MSEFHPNRQTLVKTKLGLTRRRVMESWPLLIWLAAAGFAAWGYSQGRVYSRLNGAVDVYQENISPSEDNRVVKILVKRGETVAANAVIAKMDTSLYERELTGILQSAAVTRYEEIARLERQQLDLEAERRKYEVTEAGNKARVAQLISARARLTAQTPEPNALASKALGLGALAALTNEPLDRLNADIAELEGTNAAITQTTGELQNTLTTVTVGISKLRATAEQMAKADSTSLTAEMLGGLRVGEQKNVAQIQALIELCLLRTTRGGTVDRLEKEEGEYVAKGESVMRVVAAPDQIVAFLPQDQISSLRIGQTVWITPGLDRSNVFESTVTAISPRMNNLADSTSPLPNRRIYGRDVVCAYPKGATLNGGAVADILVPGETVTVHLTRPGDIPLLNRIFHNDDAK